MKTWDMAVVRCVVVVPALLGYADGATNKDDIVKVTAGTSAAIGKTMVNKVVTNPDLGARKKGFEVVALNENFCVDNKVTGVNLMPAV